MGDLFMKGMFVLSIIGIGISFLMFLDVDLHKCKK